VAVGLQNDADSPNLGSIVSVRGGVVDVRFDRRLPPIFSVLHAGAEGKIIVEVMAQLDANRVREPGPGHRVNAHGRPRQRNAG